MSWKKYVGQYKNGRLNDSCFVLGIDLGNASSALSYFDFNRMIPEPIDISGGYGKPAMPTAMQYIYETKEWIYGEYALNTRNSDKDILVTDLLESQGKNRYLQIEDKKYSYAELLTMYIKELISNCYNINPKAEIAGIVATLPCYIGDEAKEELESVFEKAGLGQSLVSFTDERECVLARHFYNTELSDSKVLMIDFGAREVRGGVYSVKASDSDITITSISSVFNREISIGLILDELYVYLEGIYCEKLGVQKDELTAQIKEQLANFTYQHKDIILQKGSPGKTKLYFNFAYPPFEAAVEYEHIQALVAPFASKFEGFVRDVFSKTAESVNLPVSSVSRIICYGGGYEMFWTRNMMKKIFSGKKELFFKNSTTVSAEGASVLAAQALKIIEPVKLRLIDSHRIQFDIGVKAKNGSKELVPIIERNSFWWQKHQKRLFLLADSTEREVNIDVYKRDKSGEMEKLDGILLVGLPKRPPGTTRLSIDMEFIDSKNFVTHVRDLGFGELFPASKVEREYVIALNPL